MHRVNFEDPIESPLPPPQGPEKAKGSKSGNLNIDLRELCGVRIMSSPYKELIDHKNGMLKKRFSNEGTKRTGITSEESYFTFMGSEAVFEHARKKKFPRNRRTILKNANATFSGPSRNTDARLHHSAKEDYFATAEKKKNEFKNSPLPRAGQKGTSISREALKEEEYKNDESFNDIPPDYRIDSNSCTIVKRTDAVLRNRPPHIFFLQRNCRSQLKKEDFNSYSLRKQAKSKQLPSPDKGRTERSLDQQNVTSKS